MFRRDIEHREVDGELHEIRTLSLHDHGSYSVLIELSAKSGRFEVSHFFEEKVGEFERLLSTGELLPVELAAIGQWRAFLKKLREKNHAES